MRLTTIKMLIAATMTIAGATASQAMPLAASDFIGVASAIQQVGWRCGPGWHMNGCVPNRPWRRWGW